MRYTSIIRFFICLSLCACTDKVLVSPGNISSLRLIDEHIIPHNMEFQSSTVGGLSAIDFKDKTWIVLSDDKHQPRYYTAAIAYDMEGFTQVKLLTKVSLLDSNQAVFAHSPDPEALRFDPNSANMVWTSEGNIPKGISPFLRWATPTGQFVSETAFPALFQVSSKANWGPRANGTFEGLCIDASQKGYWLSLEEPLMQDGEEANYKTGGNSPIRMIHFNKATGKFDKQYAYQLDKIARKPIPHTEFAVNGVVELLAIDDTHLLVLERSYAVGYEDGGNTVKLYVVDLAEATDISEVDQLSGATFQPVRKTLLFDFDSIRDRLTQGRVDNIEGMTFGPHLPNGNRSLVVVSDNNFNPTQLTQVLVFEVTP